MAGLNILAWQINPSRFAIQPCWRCGTENGGLLLSACFKQAFTSNPTSLGRTDTGEALPCLVTDQPALAHWPCRNFRFALTIVQPKNHGSQHSHTSDVCPDMTQTTQWPAFHALCVRSSQLDQLQTANSCEFSRLDKVRDLVKITRLVHPTMPGNLDSPEASTCLGVYGGNVNLPRRQPHGQAAHNAERPKRDRKVKPRKQCQAPKARPPGQAANIAQTQVGYKTNLSETTQTRSPPKIAQRKSTLQQTSHAKSHNTDMGLSMPPHRYGPVYASPQIWTCLCLPADMDLSMPPHRYGPVYASQQIWACLCLPHRYWPVCASP